MCNADVFGNNQWPATDSNIAKKNSIKIINFARILQKIFSFIIPNSNCKSTEKTEMENIELKATFVHAAAICYETNHVKTQIL